MEILGIDIGGSGIKGAPVDVGKGVLLGERHRIDTPQPSTPQAVGDVVSQLVRHFNWSGLIGCTFPAIVKRGVTWSAANVDAGWVGFDAETMLRNKTGCPVIVINDADAAGIAEMEFGAGREYHRGVVFMITLGTGIGSAIFVNGHLLPNSELGHLELNHKEAERWTSDRARKVKELSWEEWGSRVDTYLNRLEFLFSPDLFIIGGGVSKKFDKFSPYLNTQAKIVPAQLLNDAGIVGAAIAAQHIVDDNL
jgi:polyphosphate glucokinase